MHRSSFKMRRSLGRAQKENVAEIFNNIDKETSLSTLPSIHFPCHTLNLRHVQDERKKPNRLPVLDYQKTRASKSTQHLSSCILKPIIPKVSKVTQDINEFENSKLIREYALSQLRYCMVADKCSDSLKRHEIKGSMRAKMVDWMIQVLGSYKCSDKTFFQSVQLMDDYLSVAQSTEQVKTLHLLGVCCMFMTIKLEEVVPIRLKTVYQKIGHKKLSMQSIRNKEQQVLKTMGYNILVPTVYDLVTISLNYWNLDAKLPPKSLQQLVDVSIHLAKVAVVQYKLVSRYSRNCLALSSVLLSLRVFKQMGVPDFPVQEHIVKISEMFQMQGRLEEVFECASSLSQLVVNFQEYYPQLANLKKFDRLQFEIKKFLA